MSKYHNKKTTWQGMTFDSKHEYSRWLALRGLEDAGRIKNLRRQVRYQLIPSQREAGTIGPRGGTKPGKLLERAVYYVADFVYEKDGDLIVEDAKGQRTPEYIIKRKLMLWVHGIRIKET